MKIKITNISLFVFLIVVATGSGCSSKQDIETHMRNAQLYEKEGNHKSAIIELKNVLQADPNHGEGRKLLGTVYLEIGDGVSAEKELGRAIDLGISKQEVSLSLARSQVMQGKYDEALGNLSVDTESAPDRKATVEVVRGDAYLGKGELQNASSAFQNALSIDNQNGAARIGLAQLATIEQEYQKAENFLAPISDEDEYAVDKLLVKATIAKQQSNYEEVEQNYRKAFNLSKERAGGNRALNIQGELVIALLANRKVDEALDNANQLLKSAPKSPFAKYLRGLVAYQQKDYNTVFEYLTAVLSQVPEHLPSSLLLGASSYATGNYEQANTHLTTFVNKVPTHIHARKLLGVVRLRLNKPEEAVDILKSASKAQQDSDAQLLAIIGQAVSASGDSELGVSYLKRAKNALPESDSIRAELARVYMSQGAYDKAVSELEDIKGEGKNKARVLLVYSHLRKEDFVQARKVASELVSEEPGNPAWQVVAGGVEMLAGERMLARKYFNKAIELKNDFALARINLARMEFEEGNLKGARNQFDKILAQDEKNITALLGMAQVAERYGDVGQAVSWLEKARVADEKALLPRVVLGRYYFKTGKYNDALVVAREAASVKQDNVEILRLIAASLIKLDQTGEALEVYQQVIAKNPDNPQWHFEIANIHRGMKNINLATASLKKALTLDKNFLPAKAVLVELDIESNKLDEAIDGATDLKQQFPKSSAGYLLLGEIYTRQKDLKKAQQSYLDGYRVEASLVLVNKIFLLSNALNNYDKSITVIQDWLQKHPADSVARMYLGLSYQATNKFDSAKKEYEQVIEKQPNNVMALNNMAYLLIEKDSASALDFAERARKLAPDNFAILDTYGWVLTKSGKTEEGLEVLQQALDKSNGNPSVSFHYAVALSRNNEKEKAVSILSQITQGTQEFPELADARNLLKKLQ